MKFNKTFLDVLTEQANQSPWKRIHYVLRFSSDNPFQVKK